MDPLKFAIWDPCPGGLPEISTGAPAMTGSPMSCMNVEDSRAILQGLLTALTLASR